MRLPRLRRTTTEPPLRTVQTVEGDRAHVDDVVAVLTRAGCVVEHVVELEPGLWEIAARSHD